MNIGIADRSRIPACSTFTRPGCPTWAVVGVSAQAPRWRWPASPSGASTAGSSRKAARCPTCSTSLGSRTLATNSSACCGGGQLPVDEQVSDLQERERCSELFHRVAPVVQAPRLAVDERDRRVVSSGVRIARVEHRRGRAGRGWTRRGRCARASVARRAVRWPSRRDQRGRRLACSGPGIPALLSFACAPVLAMPSRLATSYCRELRGRNRGNLSCSSINTQPTGSVEARSRWWRQARAGRLTQHGPGCRYTCRSCVCSDQNRRQARARRRRPAPGRRASGRGDGDEVSFEPVLLVDGATVLATPGELSGANVSARVVGEEKGRRSGAYLQDQDPWAPFLGAPPAVHHH